MPGNDRPPSHSEIRDDSDIPVRDDLSEDEQDSEPSPDVDLSEEMEGYDVWRYCWFIKLPEDTDTKAPKGFPWGGYSTNFEENDDVYTAEEVAASRHSRWGICGINAQPEWPTSPNLIVVDIDTYEDGAPSLSEIGISGDALMAGIEPVIVESQSGGVHIYGLVDEPPVNESEFNFPEWVDLRGEAVKQHVVAPREVPGNDADKYTIRNEASIPEFGSYSAFAELLTMDGGATQLIEYTGAMSQNVTTPEYGGDAPEDMPMCYRQALAARADEEFRDQHGNPWKVDTLAGQLGIALGYDVETVADHFEASPKAGNASEFDRNLTISHLERLVRKMRGDGGEDLRAPSALTLRGHGILDAGDSCSCNLHDHHDPDASDCSKYYAYLTESYDRDATLLRACLEIRENHPGELEGETPPYAALREIAKRAGLPMEDDGKLGEYSWSVAKSAFEDMEPGDI